MMIDAFNGVVPWMLRRDSGARGGDVVIFQAPTFELTVQMPHRNPAAARLALHDC